MSKQKYNFYLRSFKILLQYIINDNNLLFIDDCKYSPICFEFILRPSHDQQARKDMDENPLHPRSHFVSLWRSEVDIKYNHCHAYTVKK